MTQQPMGEDADADDDQDLDDVAGADEADEPWPIANRPPASMPAWVAELVVAYRRVQDPPPLETDDGRAFVPGDGGLLDIAVALCLHARGASIPVEAVYGLISVIRDMVNDLQAMGPEWKRLQQVPPLAFTVYYVWAHIVIGHLSEDLAMEVVRAATEHLEEFDAGDLHEEGPDAVEGTPGT